MMRECERVGGINLGLGACDFPTPPPVRDGAIAAIQARKSVYSHAEGIPPLREAIAEKLARDNGIAADPGEVVVTIGATGAYVATVTALLDHGDGILFFEPFYPYHVDVATLGGFEPQFVELEPPSFPYRAEDLRRAVRPNTRALVLCTPCNPSGNMLDASDLGAVAEVAEEHDLLVITDEIYEYISFDGRRHLSPAAYGDLWQRTVTIMGLSKTFSITGWRLGYAVAPEPMARAIALVHDRYSICAPTPLQHGAIDGFDLPESFFERLRLDFQAKRDLLCRTLATAGLAPIVPQGAYYVLADAAPLGCDGAGEAAMELLRRCQVAAVPATGFYRGRGGERLLRFCFATDMDVLEEACRRIGAL
jgi:aminotransferase